MTWLRLRLIRGLIWLATRLGWQCAQPHLPSDSHLALAIQVCVQVEERFPEAPSEVKRREALRMLLNLLPGARGRDLNLLIELALHT